MFLALGVLITYTFHLTGIAAKALLPMHIPVLLCGFIVGPQYGLIVGFLTPLLNSLLTGMPQIYPSGISMSLELATYGLVSGWMYKVRNKNIMISLIVSMLSGRIVLGIANYILLGFSGKQYLFQAFLMSAFVNVIWGIAIQLIIIPLVVKAVEKQREASKN
ncbi:MAG: ECF transporter S component [Clostridiaceae bacterium]|nr:ECF transporter S component [Clostridiaceae bacterium]